MKTILTVILILSIGLADNWGMPEPEIKEPVKVEYFKKGQILLPDYAIQDTLIVNDADGLNKDMALIEQGIIDATDGDIDSVFHIYCTKK